MSNSEQPTEQVDGSIPDSAKEETKQEFQKLLAHNKELSEKLTRLEAEKQQPQYASVLDELRAPTQNFTNLSPAQVEDIAAGLVDENGYIDQGLLNKTLSDANTRAKRAEDRVMLTEARMEKFEETQLIRDVHEKHPQLDPYKTDYNPEFRNAVRDEVLKQLKRGYQDYEAAADKVAAEFKVKSTAQVKSEEEKQEASKKTLSQREQASTVKGGGKVPTQVEYDDLVGGTKKGDALSIGQRLQANGY